MEQDKELWDGVEPSMESPEGTPGVPSTAGFGFLQNLVFGLVSSVSAELTITGYTSGSEPKPFTVGQITAMVIAVTTTLRATWLFIRRFDLLPMVEEKLWAPDRGFEMRLEGVAPEEEQSDGSGMSVEPPDTVPARANVGNSEQEEDKAVRPQVAEPDSNVNTTPQPQS